MYVMAGRHTAPSSTYERFSSHFSLYLNVRIFTTAVSEEIVLL